LGYGARLLARYVTRESFWRVLDGIIATVMFSIAITLLVGL
jgi:L-lysine exporter family protein LysE/ArgO